MTEDLVTAPAPAGPPPPPSIIELAALIRCQLDGRDPEALCKEAPRVNGKKPTNFHVAAQHIAHHLSCAHALEKAMRHLHKMQAGPETVSVPATEEGAPEAMVVPPAAAE